MTKTDVAREILEFAIGREMQANALFRAFANRAGEPAMRRVFEDLAKEELEHKAKLELELMKRGHVVKEAEGLAGAEELAKLRLRDYVGDVEGDVDIGYKDMLVLGMEKEDEAFKSYVNFAGRVQQQHLRELLLSLAEEELRHKLRFELEYNMLAKED